MTLEVGAKPHDAHRAFLSVNPQTLAAVGSWTAVFGAFTLQARGGGWGGGGRGLGRTGKGLGRVCAGPAQACLSPHLSP